MFDYDRDFSNFEKPPKLENKANELKHEIEITNATENLSERWVGEHGISPVLFHDEYFSPEGVKVQF